MVHRAGTNVPLAIAPPCNSLQIVVRTVPPVPTRAAKVTDYVTALFEAGHKERICKRAAFNSTDRMVFAGLYGLAPGLALRIFTSFKSMGVLI